MSWSIKGYITKCFDRIPHDKILSTIKEKEKITCVRTLTLIERCLNAGYKNEKGQIIKPNIGTPTFN